jgi:hypothetical protein
MDDTNGKNDPKEKTPPRRRILETSPDLKKALEVWDDLSKQAVKPAADDQLMSDVKELLKQLKTQIEDLK